MIALERAPGLEQAAAEWDTAFKHGDVEALRGWISDHPAVVSRGTDQTEVARGRDEMTAMIEHEIADGGITSTTTSREAYADGAFGYVYVEATLRMADGAEFPTRQLAVAQRGENGEWLFVHGLAAIPVANELLTANSPLALHTTATG